MLKKSIVKWLILFCLFGLIISSNCNAKNNQKSSGTKRNSATLQDTLDFIQRKVNSLPTFTEEPIETYQSPQEKIQMRVISQDLKYSDCDVTYTTQESELSHPNRINFYQYSFSLGDLSTETQVMGHKDNIFNVWLKTRAKRNLVTYRDFYKGKILSEDKQSFVLVHVDSLDMAKRVVNAFNHAIKLCSGAYKTDPF